MVSACGELVEPCRIMPRGQFHFPLSRFPERNASGGEYKPKEYESEISPITPCASYMYSIKQFRMLHEVLPDTSEMKYWILVNASFATDQICLFFGPLLSALDLGRKTS